VEDEIENETLIELGEPSQAPRDHLRLPIISHCLPCLDRLRVMYGVRRCGLNFNWNIFQCTLKVTSHSISAPFQQKGGMFDFGHKTSANVKILSLADSQGT